MDLISFLSYGAAAIVSAAALYGVAARRRRPIYEGSNPAADGIAFRVSAIVGTLLGLFIASMESMAPGGLELLGFARSSLGAMVAFLVALSFYTDHRYRKVDRVVLRVAILASIGFGIPRLIEMNTEAFVVLYIVSILIALATMFVPSMGDSDARAFVLLFAAGIPTLGVLYTYYAFLVGIGLWLAYGLVVAAKKRTTKVSIPMVPYILTPLAIAIAAASLLAPPLL